MIKLQQSMPLNTTLTINLVSDLQLDSASPSTVVVNSMDPISSLLDLIGQTNTKLKFLYKKQTLCPALSFSFYKIKDNDTINIVQNVSNEKVNQIPLNYQSSYDQILYNQLRLSKSLSAHQIPTINSHSKSEGNCDSLKSEFDRLTDIYRFRIESNTKSFRKLCSKYRTLVNSDSGFLRKKDSANLEDEIPKPTNKKIKGISSNMETVLPEKPTFPSTDYLPEF